MVSAVDTTVKGVDAAVAVYWLQAPPAGPHATVFADPPLGVAQCTRTEPAVASVRYGARVSAADAPVAGVASALIPATASKSTASTLTAARTGIPAPPFGRAEPRSERGRRLPASV